MPVNLYKCEKCGTVFDDEDKCLACEREHANTEKTMRVEWIWSKGRKYPVKVKILMPDANNKPYGTWAVYKLDKTGVDRDPNEPEVEMDDYEMINADEKYYRSWKDPVPTESIKIDMETISKIMKNMDDDTPF